MQTRQFLLQLAGTSGSGKSSLTLQLIRHLSAVIIDYDVIKSAALEAEIDWDHAGRVGYGAAHALAEQCLQQGWNVILDSPCRFPMIVERGMAMCHRTGTTYGFIECVLPDEQALRQRMSSRPRQRSQRIDFATPPPDAPNDAMADTQGMIQIPPTIYPTTPWLQIDTRQPLEICVQQALAYLQGL